MATKMKPVEFKVDHDNYTDDYLRGILKRVRVIAMVGASPSWNRPSNFAMKYLQAKSFRVIPVNPTAVGQEILGEKVYASLKDIPETVDMVDIFRNSAAAGPITDEAIAIGAPGAVDAARRAQRRRGTPRRGGRDDSHHEPLPEDRVRPAVRRAVVERHQFRDHLQPAAAAVSLTAPTHPSRRGPAGRCSG